MADEHVADEIWDKLLQLEEHIEKLKWPLDFDFDMLCRNEPIKVEITVTSQTLQYYHRIETSDLLEFERRLKSSFADLWEDFATPQQQSNRECYALKFISRNLHQYAIERAENWIVIEE